MSEQKVLEIQQGIWIDEQWIHHAQLGTPLRVVVRPGEIRIVGTAADAEQADLSVQGWNVFRSLGRDAPSGRLPDAAEKHDHYLYGKG